MTNDEMKSALLSKVPVILTHFGSETEYSRISAIRYREQDGSIVASAELLDENNNSVTIAGAEKIRIKN